MKAKKVLAMLMASAMIMGTSVTAFAEPVDVTSITSDITVNGLSYGVNTTVKAYKFATLQYDAETNEYTWKIESWAGNYVKLNAEGTEYEIQKKDESALKDAATTYGNAIEFSKEHKEDTKCVLADMAIGGYVIIPNDTNADYEPLFVVNNYDRTATPGEDGTPVAVDVDAYAKSEGHTVTKEQGDSFAQIGQNVNYTIRATFPMSENTDGDTLSEFTIVDTPVGLSIDLNSVVVKLAGNTVTDQINKEIDPETGALTVNFASLLTGDHAGKSIEITYSATVTDTSYNNTVWGNSDTTDYEPGNTEGDTGSITITKVDAENPEKTLNGAEFYVYDMGSDEWKEDTYTPMELVFDADMRAYRPALESDDPEDVITEIPTVGAVLKIVGLDEGNYHFEEIYAPDGYSINDLGLTVTVNEGASADVTDNFEDTKLSALPSTGGIGTTIFTIGGCAIMVTAAGLYFATRKKTEK